MAYPRTSPTGSYMPCTTPLCCDPPPLRSSWWDTRCWLSHRETSLQNRLVKATYFNQGALRLLVYMSKGLREAPYHWNKLPSYNPFYARYDRSGILPLYAGYRSGRIITHQIAIPSGGARCRRTLALISSSSRILEVTIVISNMAEVDRERRR